jgi:hypothetical protein
MQFHDDDIGYAGCSVAFDYDFDTDSIVLTTTTLTDGGRTSDDTVSVIPVSDADARTLRDAIEWLDSIMLDELCDDDMDNADELRTVFRSIFMPLHDAVAKGAA